MSDQYQRAGTAMIKLAGRVEKLLKGPDPEKLDRIQIVVEGCDSLYGELRVKNSFQNEKGEEVALVPGAEIEITMTVRVTADTHAEPPKASD